MSITGSEVISNSDLDGKNQRDFIPSYGNLLLPHFRALI